MGAPRRSWKGAAAAAAAGLLAAGVYAHVRLHNPGNGNSLFWPAPGSISIVINSTGSDNIPDGSHTTSIRSAIRSWNDVSGTSMQLVEDTSPASQARTDWGSAGIHLILFDESNSSGFFPSGSGIVAITPVWFFSTGAISDADILFNGSQFTFTTDAGSSAMDVEDVVAHELGHLLGLDHSANGGATMYPFVSGSVIAHRSLSEDEVHGMRDAYPSGSFATLTGTVARLSDATGVPGAWVVARDAAGRTAGAALADGAGAFSIVGLDAGTYTVYAVPLDAPVSSGNLTAGHPIQTNFEPAFYAGSTVVSGPGSTALGTLFVDADVALNLGAAGDALPIQGIADGVARAVSIRGTGLNAGSTLTPSDPAVTVVPGLWLGSQVNFTVTVPMGTPPGHVDLEVTNVAGDLSVLPAAIEVLAPPPTVASVAPGVGQATGGASLTITGTGFRPGARVAIGGVLYVDGDANGTTVVDPTTITLTTAATAEGTHDVVVMDSTGTEGRMTNAYSAASLPVVDSVFPSSGTSVGGTEIVLSGQNFFAGIAVRIDGVSQPQVTLESSTRVRVSTEAGAPGGPYVLEVENPGGLVAQSAFAYVAQADPDVMAIDPSTGVTVGGETIRLTGTGFTADTAVEFGVDPDTGLGGTPAASVVFVDANNLDVVTPAHGGGATSVMARVASSGQAMVVAAGFTFVEPASGGGGCHTSLLPPPAPRGALWESAWLLALVLWALVHAQRARRDPAALRARVVARRR